MRKLLLTSAAVLMSAAAASASLAVKQTISGKIRLSIDGAGTNADCSNSANWSIHRCQLRIEKPNANSTAKRVFMAAASAGTSAYQIQNGDIKVDGATVTWEGAGTPTQTASSISSYNVWAELTATSNPAIFSKLNAAAPGLILFTVTEQNTYSIDGEIMVVIWDDPTAPQTTVSLMYGAQSTTGDAFAVTLAQPLDKTNPATVLDMSLGISFGYQPAGQYSILELGINGTRISTSAGGHDDGEDQNGALITVGGYGDTNDNPADPYQDDYAPNSPRYDDELYNLLPFLNDGATTFTVNTRNPSNDDNIFFAAIVLGNNTAAVGEGITLAPATQSENVGTNKTVQATVQNSLGNPISGRNVTFKVTSGVNTGLTATLATNASGIASYTYASSLAGSDTLVASMTNSSGNPQSSNSATISWLGVNAPTTSVAFTNTSGDATPVNQNYALSARVVNNLGQPQAGRPVTFTALAGPRAGVLGSSTTNASGIATLAYTSTTAGTDTLQASIPGPVNSSTITHDWTVVTTPSLFLSPSASTNPINGRSTMKVQAMDSAGAPVSGQAFSVTTSAGPNHPKTLSGTTGPDGSATVFYSSTVGGTDTWSVSATVAGVPTASGNATSSWTGLLCDADNNGQVDIDDINSIRGSLNLQVPTGDRRDANFDGVITSTDATACVSRCTNARCAK